MSRKPRRDIDLAGLSFLDCICCGFGAIILLLVVVKIHDPTLTQGKRDALLAAVARLNARMLDLVTETSRIEAELEQTLGEAEAHRAEVTEAQVRLSRAESLLGWARNETTALAEIQRAAQRAQQQLTSEVERLLQKQKLRSQAVGGIPADSEYIIFVIDTSGSMVNYNWERAVQKLAETLQVYPKVKGIQVLNDEGNYMFSQYAGRWIPDSPVLRKAILERMVGWRAFSNSSPVEGIEKAIRTFHSWDKQISIYVFGDEFAGGESAQEVIETIRRLNRPDARSQRRVRIHGVGFSIDTTDKDFRNTNQRFAMLMRALSAENGGTFVGL